MAKKLVVAGLSGTIYDAVLGKKPGVMTELEQIGQTSV